MKTQILWSGIKLQIKISEILKFLKFSILIIFIILILIKNFLIEDEENF